MGGDADSTLEGPVAPPRPPPPQKAHTPVYTQHDSGCASPRRVRAGVLALYSFADDTRRVSHAWVYGSLEGRALTNHRPTRWRGSRPVMRIANCLPFTRWCVFPRRARRSGRGALLSRRNCRTKTHLGEFLEETEGGGLRTRLSRLVGLTLLALRQGKLPFKIVDYSYGHCVIRG